MDTLDTTILDINVEEDLRDAHGQSVEVAQKAALSAAVKQVMEKYFQNSEALAITDLYDVFLAEVEVPFLEQIMRHTRGNQSKAAALLGLSRGTLRKKLKMHGFLNK